MDRVKRGIMLSVCILIAGFLFIASRPNASVDAYERSTQFEINYEEMIRITLKDSYSMRLYADGKPHFQASALKIFLETNSYYGYDFVMEADDTNLVNVNDPNAIITNMRTENNLVNPDDTIPMNTWGIGVVKESGNFQDVFYSSGVNIPLNKYTYMGGNTDITAHDRLNFVIGAKIDDTVPSGTYSASIRFSIIPKVKTDHINSIRYLQEMNNTVKETMVSDQVYKLKDLRDNKSYYIAKTQNGTIMMLQNLDYDLSQGETLGEMTSNIASQYKDLSNTADHVSIDYNQAVYVSGNNVYRDDSGNETINNEEPETVEEANKKAGGYYSYAAAIANSTNLYSTDGMNNNSICPKKWRLPTHAEAESFNTYYTANQWNDGNGFIDLENNLVLNRGQLYWTAEIDRANKNVRVYSRNSLADNYIDARELASVRCTYEGAYAYKITLDYGDGVVQTVTSDSFNTATYATIQLDNNYLSNATRRVIGFSENPGSGTPTYQITNLMGDYVSSCIDNNGDDVCNSYIRLRLTKSETTLYANWTAKCNRNATTIEQAVCMQDVNSEVRKSMTFNEQYRLIDERDGQKYWIARLDDDQIWMTQNLNYVAGKKGHYVDESDVMETTISTIDASMEEGYYMKNGYQKRSLDNQPDNVELKHYNLGKYYTGAQTEVCPGKWHIGNIADAMKAAGIINSDDEVTNNSAIAGDGVVYDSTLTKEKLFGAPLYLTVGGYREYEKSYGQGTRAKYISQAETTNIVSIGLEGDNVIVSPQANRGSTEYGQIRCVAPAKGMDEIEYMQDITPEIILSTKPDSEFQMKDRRDNKTYWIRKDPDSKVYMIQNLDFEIPTTGITFTKEDTDGEGYIENATYISNLGDDMYLIYQKDGGDYYVNPNNNQLVSTENLSETSENWKYHVGSFYTASAVSLGQAWNGLFQDATICPKNWTIETRSVPKYSIRIGDNDFIRRGASVSTQILSSTYSKVYIPITGPNEFGNITVVDYNTNYGYGRNGSAGHNYTSALYPVRCVVLINLTNQVLGK